jgi:hypothetical protein
MLRPDISTEEGARRFQSSPHSYGSERTPPIPLGAESAGCSCPPGRFQPLPIYHGENDCSKHRNRFFRIPVQGRRRQTMVKKGDHMEAACRRRALSKMAKARVTSVGLDVHLFGFSLICGDYPALSRCFLAWPSVLGIPAMQAIPRQLFYFRSSMARRHQFRHHHPHRSSRCSINRPLPDSAELLQWKADSYPGSPKPA